MKCKAILLAGGSGARFGAEIPKQFLKVNGIPIIIYTLKRLQAECVSGIIVVCINEWIEYLEEIIEQYEIGKVELIVPGGTSAYDSICKGYRAIEKSMDVNDVVLIHDAVRPLLPKSVIEDSIEKAGTYGNGFASLRNIEGLVLMEDEHYGLKPADRYHIMRIQTPQSIKCGLLNRLLEQAEREGKYDFSYTEALLEYFGEPIYFSKSFTGNMKITTRPDVAYFKAMLQFSDEELMGKA